MTKRREFVIAFNGPPHSGKDTIANHLATMMIANYTKHVARVQLSLPMRLSVCALLGIEYNERDYDICKDQLQELTGESFRKTMIQLSENFVKPTYGHDYWVKAAMARMPERTRVIIISDLGFQHEIDYLESVYGKDNVLVVQLAREGTDWNKDSRNYVFASNILKLDNNATVSNAAVAVRRFCTDVLRWNLVALCGER